MRVYLNFLGFDAFGDLLQPSGVTGGVAIGPQSSAAVKPAPGPSNKVLTGDLDSSLASLAMNLTINKTATPKYSIILLMIFVNQFFNCQFCDYVIEPASGILDRRQPIKLAPQFNLNNQMQGSGIHSR